MLESFSFQAVTITNPLQGWPVLLGVAAPFIIALAFLGKWLISRLEKAEEEKRQLYEKVMNDFLIAMNQAKNAISTNSEALSDLVQFVRDVRDDAKDERDLRIRLEERLQMDERIKAMFPENPERGSGRRGNS